MRKSYTRGSRLLIVITLLVFGYGCLSWNHAITNLRDERTLYQEGNYFDGSSGTSIAQVLGIEELDLEDKTLAENEKFYMLESEHAFVILKASQEDLKKIIGDRWSDGSKVKKFTTDKVYSRVTVVPEKTYRRRGSRINITPELQEKFSKASDSSILVLLRMATLSKKYTDWNMRISKIKERPFYTNIYIVPSGDWYHVFNIGFALFMTVISGIMIYTIVKQIRFAKNSYERLFMTYPEVKHNLNLLLEEAAYVDKKLKVLVYKDAMIVYKSIFEFEEFIHINKVIFQKVTSKGRVTGYTLFIERKYNWSKYSPQIRINKKNRKLIKDFGSYLIKNYSIKVSYYL